MKIRENSWLISFCCNIWVFMNNRKPGIAIIGLGGAVGTTIVAGIELLKKGKIGTDGLPLAILDAHSIKDLVDYKNIVFAG